MTETDRPPEGDESTWDVIDEAVRARLPAFLQVPSGMFADPDLMGRLDPLSLLPALARTGLSAAGRPDRVAAVVARGAADMVTAATSAAVRAFGGTPASDSKHAKDKRFADPTWTGNASYWLLRETYLVWGRCLLDVVREANTSPEVKRKAEFAVQLVIDALAPTNFPVGNPEVLKRAFESGGLSLMRGARNFARDLVTNGGTPRQVAADVHQVGVNMALSPGKVVLRNELMELIQYAPSTGEVHEVPLLFSPPWINKYYVMDLAPGRSLVEWAVQHGHTVFMISYRNPDETMSKVRLDDYLLSGPLEALEAITDITGSEKVNLLGLCLGGTLTMATLAYLDAVGVDKINSATFLNTLIDFSDPGLMGVFTDKTTISRLEQTMKKTGFLPAENMRRSFDLMRANDLIWNYVVSNWMLGEDPPAFDLLSWNADSTRMPADMHSFYLRSCYLENQLARGVMELAGQRLDLGTVDQDLYFLAAEQDHIAPWRSSYRGARLPAGDVRFVLSNSGHIAGIVNPPNPKSIHRVAESGAALPADPGEWLARAQTHPTTWWQDWATWIAQRAGAMREPPPMGNARFSPLADAPGEYVLER
jgi:polyhydroxyalkanoate synthase subunit PhaC